MFTDDTYGDAKLLPSTIDSIREKFTNRIDPNVIAVVTGFIGEYLTHFVSSCSKFANDYRKNPRRVEIRRRNALFLAYGTLQVTTRAEDHGPDRPISPNPYMRHSFCCCFNIMFDT